MTDGQKDLCAGLALLYMGPEAKSDQYIERMLLAIKTENVEEAEHLSAVLLTLLIRRGTLLPERISERWEREFEVSSLEGKETGNIIHNP